MTTNTIHTITQAEMDRQAQFMRLFGTLEKRPEKAKKIEFIGIPNNSIALVNNEQASIKNNYQSGGAASAKDFVEAVFGVKVDDILIVQ